MRVTSYGLSWREDEIDRHPGGGARDSFRLPGGLEDAVRERMREIANERRRLGYRWLAILLTREGEGMNLKHVCWLYREERLTVRNRGDQKRALLTSHAVLA